MPVTICRDRIDNDTLLLRTEKAGTLVRVPLPQAVIEALAACPGPRYAFWSGNGKRKSVVTDWQRAFAKLFKLAGVHGVHPHRFRDTFACELLQAGVSLTLVSRLPGHSSEGITERHYSAWVKGRQEQLEAARTAAFPADFDSATGTKPVQRSESRRRKRQKANKNAGQ